MIIHCSKDERGQYTGGAAGDQTGQECVKRAWYSNPWTCLLRHSTAGPKIAELAEQAAANNNIGYDQNERQTFYNALQLVSYLPANISTPCEADCSSFVCSIIKAAGHILNDARLQNVNPFNTTHTMRQALLAAGFVEVNTNLASEAGAIAGDIWLNDSMHTAIEAANSAAATQQALQQAVQTAQSTVQQAKALPYMAGEYPVIKPANAGTKYSEVKALQGLLNLHGYNLTCDGVYGPQTQNAVYKAQLKFGLTADREAGAETFEALIKNA